jgi:outer membrane protein TolC
MTHQGRWTWILLLTATAFICGCRAPQAARPLPASGGPAENQIGAAQPEQSVSFSAQNSPEAAVQLVTHVDAPQPDSIDIPDAAEELPVPPDWSEQGPVRLNRVVRSVIDAYPLLRVVAQERPIRDGKVLSSWGDFDLQLKAFGIAAPEGFYENYRNGFALTQPVFHGGYAYGGYKIGRGDFQPWFKERETNDGGEFAVGFGTPLLQGRAIDKRRANLFQAEIDREAAEPLVETSVLEFVRTASIAYWVWVASGQALDARQQLLQLAERRVEQINNRVEAGDLPRLARINNNQLIAARETKVIEAQRELQFAAINLSMFLRDPRGAPIVATAEMLPKQFPERALPAPEQIDADVALALAARPELVELELMIESVNVELANARNMMLPKLDAQVLASKDVGGPASPSRNKSPFEFEAGIYGEVPLQRRTARGKVVAAQGKLGQLRAKREFQMNKITAEVQKAVAALVAEAGRIDRSKTNLQLALETLSLAREQFDAGDIDVLAMNLYEAAVMDAQLILIAAQADYFAALANYHAALALDPLRPTLESP